MGWNENRYTLRGCIFKKGKKRTLLLLLLEVEGKGAVRPSVSPLLFALSLANPLPSPSSMPGRISYEGQHTRTFYIRGAWSGRGRQRSVVVARSPERTPRPAKRGAFEISSQQQQGITHIPFPHSATGYSRSVCVIYMCVNEIA